MTLLIIWCAMATSTSMYNPLETAGCATIQIHFGDALDLLGIAEKSLYEEMNEHREELIFHMESRLAQSGIIPISDGQVEPDVYIDYWFYGFAYITEDKETYWCFTMEAEIWGRKDEDCASISMGNIAVCKAGELKQTIFEASLSYLEENLTSRDNQDSNSRKSWISTSFLRVALNSTQWEKPLRVPRYLPLGYPDAFKAELGNPNPFFHTDLEFFGKKYPLMFIQKDDWKGWTQLESGEWTPLLLAEDHSFELRLNSDILPSIRCEPNLKKPRMWVEYPTIKAGSFVWQGRTIAIGVTQYPNSQETKLETIELYCGEISNGTFRGEIESYFQLKNGYPQFELEYIDPKASYAIIHVSEWK